MSKRSVILLSGGLDSAANLALCAAPEFEGEPVLALTVNYGQRAAASEIRSAGELARYYGVRHEVVGLEWLGQLGGSALTDAKQEVPQLGRGQLDDLSVTRKSATAVWVPNRNGVLVNVAAAFAERIGAERVVVGFNREEGATFPDNTEDYLQRVTHSFQLSTATGVELFSYTVRWDKREIVQALRALKKPFPFERIWSCYFSGEKPCGQCESCQRQKRALEAGTDR